MVNWGEILRDMKLASTQHEKLKKRFDEFASAFRKEVAEEKFEVPGIVTDGPDGADFFVIHFAGREIRCEFLSQYDKAGHYVGTVAYGMDLPIGNDETERVELGAFSYRTNGETDQLDQDGSKISLDENLAHLILNFHFMRLSLNP